MKHSPGPWLKMGRTIYVLQPARGSARLPHEAGNRFTAYVERGGTSDISEEELEANADLIAAAPELLESLKTLVDAIGHLGVSYAWKQEHLDMDAAWTGAQKVIKKATNDGS